jgi:hypothetical protein
MPYMLLQDLGFEPPRILLSLLKLYYMVLMTNPSCQLFIIFHSFGGRHPCLNESFKYAP